MRHDEFCCEWLSTISTTQCPEHPDRTQCVDTVLHRYPDGTWGIPIHDGGGSYYGITYCPGCGSKLPEP